MFGFECLCVIFLEVEVQLFSDWVEGQGWQESQVVDQQDGYGEQVDEQWIMGWEIVWFYWVGFFCCQVVGDGEDWQDVVEVVDEYGQVDYQVVEWCVGIEIGKC